MAAWARRAVGCGWLHRWRAIGTLALVVLLVSTAHADSFNAIRSPSPGQLAWWADRLAALDQLAAVAESQVALAEDRWRRTQAKLSRSDARTAEIEQERLRIGRDLDRVDMERAELAQERHAVECRVGVALAAFSRRQPATGRELSQTRLVLADMVRLVAMLRARADRLAAVRARHSLALRATIGEARLRQNEAAVAGERLRAGWRAWRTAGLARTELEARRGAVERAMRTLVAEIETVGNLALARTPEPTTMVSIPKVHKRAIELETRLDRRLLRAVNGWPEVARIPKVRAGPADVALSGGTLTGPLAPISGAIQPGAPLPGGAPSLGLSIVSGIDQTVSAPVAGKVAFAAPFPGFDLLLIIDEGRGYHVVLSGMTQLDVRQGASVVAGQAIGEIAARGDEPVRLHVELRYRGLPVDPAPWLAAHQDKVRS